MTRQRILDGDDPVTVHAVLNEAVLRRQVGSPEIMKDQLGHLLECGERSNIEVRVLPLSSGSPTGTVGAFRIFTLGPPFEDEAACQETVAGRIYVESPETQPFVAAYDRLQDVALTASESMELISAVAKEWL